MLAIYHIYVYIYLYILSDKGSFAIFQTLLLVPLFQRFNTIFFAATNNMLFILPDCVSEMRDGSDENQVVGRSSICFLYSGETQGIPMKCGWKGTAVDENL